MSVLVVVEMVMALRPNMLRALPLFDLVGHEPTSHLSNLSGIPGGKPPQVEAAEMGATSAEVEARIATLGAEKNLTATEMSIALLLARGRNRAFIATKLGYSQNTIRNYTRSLYQKLGIHSKQELLDILEL